MSQAYFVMPEEAGSQQRLIFLSRVLWTPAFAGATK
jgi:hypothetical protein